MAVLKQTRISKPKLWVLAAVLAVTFVAYLPALSNQFTTWDDDSHLYANETVRSLAPQNIRRIFTSTVYDSYIPLTVLTFATEYYFFGYDPFIYHLDNVLLHLCVTALVFFLALRLGLPLSAGFFGALLFGVHPMHVESVAWITERKDVLYGVFYLLSVLFYLKYTEYGSRRAFVASLVLGLLSMLSKAMALSLPLVLLALDWYRQRGWSKKIWWEKVPYFLFVVPIAFITYSLNARIPGRSLGEGALTFVWTLMFYLRKFVFPSVLLPYYPFPEPVTLSNGHFYFAVLGLTVVAAALFRFRRQRLFVFSFVYFFLSIFYLLRYDHMIDTTIVSDRFIYLPSLGFCLFLGWALSRLWRAARRRTDASRPITVTLLCGLFLLLSVKTSSQSYIWRDGVSLWDENIARHPDQHYPYYFRAHAYAQQGDWQKALQDYNRCLELNPGFLGGYNDRGLLFTSLDQYDLAMADFDQALTIRPRSYEALLNRANLYFLNKEYGLAAQGYRQALQAKPQSAFPHIRLAEITRLTQPAGEEVDLSAMYTEAVNTQPLDPLVYLRRGEYYAQQGYVQLAVNDLTRALELDAAGIEALVQRGNLYFQLQQLDQAIADYSRAIDLNGDFAEIFSNRGLCYFVKQEHDLALTDFNRALDLDANSIGALDNRSVIYAQRGLNDLALHDINRSLSLVSDNPATYFNRGLIYQAQGLPELAVADYEKALELDGNFIAAKQALEQLTQVTAVVSGNAENNSNLKFMQIDQTF